MRALFSEKSARAAGKKGCGRPARKAERGLEDLSFFLPIKQPVTMEWREAKGMRERQIFQKLFTADILQESFCQNSCTAPERSCCEKPERRSEKCGPCEKNCPRPLFYLRGHFFWKPDERRRYSEPGRGNGKSQSKDGKNHLVESEAVCTNAP